jgi:hypothetical protein
VKIARCIVCELAGTHVAASRRGLFCIEHLALLPHAYQERLEALRRGWRARMRGRSVEGGLPNPLPWEVNAHRWLFPEARGDGIPNHPYTRWYTASCACAAWVLTRLWEGAFALPPMEPSHVNPPNPCSCPLCALAKAVAVKAVERRN